MLKNIVVYLLRPIYKFFRKNTLIISKTRVKIFVNEDQ